MIPATSALGVAIRKNWATEDPVTDEALVDAELVIADLVDAELADADPPDMGLVDAEIFDAEIFDVEIVDTDLVDADDAKFVDADTEASLVTDAVISLRVSIRRVPSSSRTLYQAKASHMIEVHRQVLPLRR